jgi:ATP-dependent exoDNAse (exonuclease V) beta subunit
MTRAADAFADDPTNVVGTNTPSHRADSGVAWGTFIHGLLEHAMRHERATRDDLYRLAMWMTVQEPQLRALIDQALATVEGAAHADYWKAAQEHVRSVETPFVLSHSGRLTNGVIDLMFEQEEAWHVVDYKTDLSLDDRRYATQLAFYRAALQSLGRSVVTTSVVNIRAE